MPLPLFAYFPAKEDLVLHRIADHEPLAIYHMLTTTRSLTLRLRHYLTRSEEP